MKPYKQVGEGGKQNNRHKIGKGRKTKKGVWQTVGKAGETWNNRQINKESRKTGMLQKGIEGCHRGETVGK